MRIQNERNIYIVDVAASILQLYALFIALVMYEGKLSVSAVLHIDALVCFALTAAQLIQLYYIDMYLTNSTYVYHPPVHSLLLSIMIGWVCIIFLPITHTFHYLGVVSFVLGYILLFIENRETKNRWVSG